MFPKVPSFEAFSQLLLSCETSNAEDRVAFSPGERKKLHNWPHPQQRVGIISFFCLTLCLVFHKSLLGPQEVFFFFFFRGVGWGTSTLTSGFQRKVHIKYPSLDSTTFSRANGHFNPNFSYPLNYPLLTEAMET